MKHPKKPTLQIAVLRKAPPREWTEEENLLWRAAIRALVEPVIRASVEGRSLEDVLKEKPKRRA
jgi:hypothetical protein